MVEFDDSFYTIIMINCYLNSYFPNESYFNQLLLYKILLNQLLKINY